MSALDFNATTAGERLFQFVLKNLFPNTHYSAVQSLEILSVGGRAEALSQYFVGVSAMNILGRCIKKARRVMEIDDVTLHHQEMVTFIQSVLGVAKQDDDVVDQLARLSLHAASVSGQKINPSTRKAVREGRDEVPCYICGTMCLHRTEEKDFEIQYEHLWPSSFGGESLVANILPCCPRCNGEKNDMLLWHTGHLFSFVLKPQPSPNELTRVSRREKIARHMMTIFERACSNGCSLKEAALAVGPANIQNIVPIDSYDAVDFFNFEFS